MQPWAEVSYGAWKGKSLVMQDEGNKVKTPCKISLSWLSCLAAGTVGQEWDPGENLAGGWIFMVLTELFKFL